MTAGAGVGPKDRAARLIWARRCWLLGVVILFAAACGSADDADETQDVLAAIPVDAQASSPAPGVAPASAVDEPVAQQEDVPALDLGDVGGSAAASALPSAVPSDLDVGFTEEGYPYRGSPDAAVTLVEYSDYACPFCGRYTSENAPLLLEEYVATGDVRFVFREFPLVSIHPTAPAGHAAAVCAGEQSAQLYWLVHDEIFVRQEEWSSLPDPADFFAGLVAGVGVEMDAYAECLASGRAEERIAADVAEAQSLGFNGTPSFQVTGDGVDGTFNIIGAQALDVFRTYFDSLLGGEAPSDPEPPPGEEPEPPGLPFWADVDGGLQPDPDRPGVNLAGDQYKGNPDAAIAVIEFSDFQCPFCRDHVLQVQPEIDAELVETGQVMWVYKHLPLSIHPLAPIAGAAAECASDQGRFWEMHERLFETVDVWTASVDTEASLVSLAGELGLDVGPFETCLAGRDALERVLADQGEASGVVSQTPSFVVIRGERGNLIEGSRPADEFVRLLQGYVADAEGGG